MADPTDPRSHEEAIASAWTRVVFDRGCSDIYFCPASDDIECSRHGGFDICCDRTDEHVPVQMPQMLRARVPNWMS